MREKRAHSSYIPQGLRDRREQYACSKQGGKANPSQTLATATRNFIDTRSTMAANSQHSRFDYWCSGWNIHLIFFFPAHTFICGLTFVDRESLCVASSCLLVLFRYSSLTPTCRLNDENTTFLFLMWIYMSQRWTCNCFSSFLNPGCRQGGAVRQKLPKAGNIKAYCFVVFFPFFVNEWVTQICPIFECLHQYTLLKLPCALCVCACMRKWESSKKQLPYLHNRGKSISLNEVLMCRLFFHWASLRDQTQKNDTWHGEYKQNVNGEIIWFEDTTQPERWHRITYFLLNLLHLLHWSRVFSFFFYQEQDVNVKNIGIRVERKKKLN